MIIEQVIYNYLSEALDVPVYTNKPSDAPGAYVLIDRIAGGMSNYVSSASFAIQSYADSLLDACELNERVKESMLNIITLDMISSVAIESDYNFTDTTKKKFRYQSTYGLVFLFTKE